MTNYTEDNKERNPEIEKMVFDILDCALMNAERAVQMMKLKEKHKQEGDFYFNYRKQRLCIATSYFMPYQNKNIKFVFKTVFLIRKTVKTIDKIPLFGVVMTPLSRKNMSDHANYSI